MKPASVTDYREMSRRRLPRLLFDYVDGGSYAESTLRRNVSDFDDVRLRQRVFVDVSKISLNTELFGHQLSMPLLLAPVGMAGMYARRGEVQAARAAAGAGIPFCLSTVSVCSMEEVARDATIPWYQLYVLKDRGYMAELMARARDIGSPALVLTGDLPRPGARYRDMRTGMFGNKSLLGHMRTAWDGITHPRWLWDVYLNGRPHSFGNIAAAAPDAQSIMQFWPWVSKNFDPTLTWKDIHWVREHWSGPLIIKGILDEEDARSAISAGAEGIVVSNHGGRQLDGVPSGIAALPPIADAVGGEMTILMDGGVRSGLDIVKALALGARGCLIGRPWAWALGGAGQAGVAHMIEILRQEMVMALTLTGCVDVNAVSKEMLAIQAH